MRGTMWVVPALMASVAMTAACSNGDLGPDDGLTSDEAVALALDLDATTGDIILGELLFGGFSLGEGLGVNSGDVRTFERERACPLGGKVTLSGSVERERNGEGAVEFTLAATGVKTDCTRQARNELTLTVNGTFSLEAYRKRVNGQPVGPQTTTKKGQFDWARSDGETGSCEFDLTSVRDPAAGKRTVKGTICGREIDRELSWGKSEG
jgi:hypothetical protein